MRLLKEQQLNASSSIQKCELSCLEIAQESQSPSLPPAPSFPPARETTRMYATLGYISAILSLFIVPETFGSAAIILGAYTWRKEQGNRGLTIVILGIIFMLVGLYFTSFFELGDVLPS